MMNQAAFVQVRWCGELLNPNDIACGKSAGRVVKDWSGGGTFLMVIAA